MMKKIAAVFVIFLLISSCSDKEKEYDKTKAVSVFSSIDVVKADPNLAQKEIIIPQQKNLSSWTGSASAQNQLSENLAKSFSQKNSGFFGGLFSQKKEISLSYSSAFWSFYSGELREHFVYSPVFDGDKVYILDTAGTLSAYNLSSEKRLWKSQIFKKPVLKNYRTPRLGFANGVIFAVAGVNQIVAAESESGKILWSKTISSIPLSNPVSDGKLVYVTTNDNKLYALKVEDGDLDWVHSGIGLPAGIFGVADPVIYQDFVVAAYSSGEIYALKKQTGETAWSQDLNISKATNSDFYLNDIDATPVVRDGVVYAIGNGGLTGAIRLSDGSFLWKKPIAGIVDFWLAGEFVFLIDNSNKLVAINVEDGAIKWVSQLPDFKKADKPQTKFFYSGVVMAGDKLLISRADGQLILASPIDGKIEKNLEFDKKIFHAPIVVNDKIYLHSIGKYTIDLIEIK